MIVKVQSACEEKAHIYYEYESSSIPLGIGGMGTVYQGCCFREGDRTQFIPVAIKRLDYSTQELVDRAMREASVQIDHDNLLRMYGFIPNMETDFLTNERVIRYYVVMEFLNGVNLDDILNGKCTDSFGNECDFAEQLYSLYMSNRHDFVRHIMFSILAGVKALHKKGIVHRDLDPTNIMVTNEGKIKVIDFGISKKIDAGHVNNSIVHVSGAMMGKVDYAAPEMIRGDVVNHNFSTDIYALGIIMYQLYTGRLPFNGTRDEIAKYHLEVPVYVDDINDVPLRELIRKSTQKKQSDRYQNIDELIEDFSRNEQKDVEVKRFAALMPNSSMNDLNSFVAEFPSGQMTETIRLWIRNNEENTAFERLSEHSEIEQLDTFLSMFPDGKHYDTVLAWKERSMFRRLSIDSSKEEFKMFRESFPDSTFANEVRKMSKAARKHQRKPIPTSIVIGICSVAAVIGVVIGLIVSFSL